MTQTSIAFCDLCGNPYEIGSQMHGAEIMADVFVKNYNIYRERFHVCLGCLERTGLVDIFRKMAQVKKENEKKKKDMGKRYLQTNVDNVLKLQKHEERG